MQNFYKKKQGDMKPNTENHIFDYDCRETAKNYVNVSSVLAGFAFTAIVLILDKKLDATPYLNVLRDKSCMAFLTGLFGCLVSAFTFSVLSGESSLNRRVFSAMLIGGGSFTLSGTFLFWGIVALMQIFVSPDIVGISKWIFLCTVFFVLIFLLLGALDVFFKSDSLVKSKFGTNSLSAFLWMLSVTLLPLVIAFNIRFLHGFDLDLLKSYFNPIVSILLFITIIEGLSTVILLNFNENLTLSLTQLIIWLLVHSIILSSMVIILP
jgi:hypothetical protein